MGKKYNLPNGYPLLPTLFRSNDFLANPIKFISASMDKFGGTYTATLGLSKKIILTQDPDFINYILKVNHKNYHKSPLATERAVEFFGNGLLFSNGDYWLRQRRLIQPAFHKEKLYGLYGIVNRTIDEVLDGFPDGQVDVYPLIHQLSFNILIRSLFDIKLSPAIMQELSDHFTTLQEFLMRDVNRPVQRILYPFNGVKRAHLEKAKRLKQILHDIIAERRAGGGEYSDLLDMLLSSRYEDTGEAMTDEQIIDEALILIFAGHETTANALTWMLYLLAGHRDKLNKVKGETDRILSRCKDISAMDKQTDDDAIAPASLITSTAEVNDHGANSVNDLVLRNQYFNAVINETMRMYPPAWMTERVALADDEFAGWSYPKGTIIIPFFYGLHHNKDIWKDESVFEPERFIEDEKLARSRNFFPFGAGPRMCIGNNFAMAEMCFLLFAFFRKFDVRATSQPPAMRPLITLRADKMVLELRRLANDRLQTERISNLL